MRFLRVIAALTLAACAQAQAPAAEDGWQPIAVTASPAPISEKHKIGARYGALIFRGGLELKSPNPLFGGWSGLEVDAAGRFIAISDQGSFLSGAIETNEGGDLVGLTDTHIGIMRGEDGQPLDSKQWQDAEDIALLHDGRYAVSFERHHRILIYDIANKGPLGAAGKGPSVPQDLDENEGIEALVQAPDGDLIAGREFSVTHKPPTQFFKLKLDGSGMTSGPAQVRRDYALVSLRVLPDGDYLALERYYFPLIGMRTVLQRYKASGLAASKPQLAGPELANLKKPLAVDNFEGLAVVPRDDGGARIYILSDDNFSATQRTLLYAFDLPDQKVGPKPKKAP